MKTLTMITRHGISKDNISAYTLITSDYQTVQKSAKELADLINKKAIVVTNLTVGPKGIESTNGAIDKYTFVNLNTNQVEGTARAVIIDRVEQGGKLLGYTVFTQNGILAELNTVDAVALANKGLISNGKIRHTSDGDIVSSIGGNYPLRVIEMNKAPRGEISADILYFGTAVGTNTEYAGVIISCTSATEMSKIIDVVNKSNAKIIAAVAKVAGQSVRESLAVKRMGANSVYGIVDIAVLDKLVKANATVGNNLGKFIVSAVKYTKDETDEATVELSKDWKVIADNTAGSNAANSAKAFAKKVVETFGSVKVK